MAGECLRVVARAKSLVDGNGHRARRPQVNELVGITARLLDVLQVVFTETAQCCLCRRGIPRSIRVNPDTPHPAPQRGVESIAHARNPCLVLRQRATHLHLDGAAAVIIDGAPREEGGVSRRYRRDNRVDVHRRPLAGRPRPEGRLNGAVEPTRCGHIAVVVEGRELPPAGRPLDEQALTDVDPAKRSAQAHGERHRGVEHDPQGSIAHGRARSLTAGLYGRFGNWPKLGWRFSL